MNKTNNPHGQLDMILLFSLIGLSINSTFTIGKNMIVVIAVFMFYCIGETYILMIRKRNKLHITGYIAFTCIAFGVWKIQQLTGYPILWISFVTGGVAFLSPTLHARVNHFIDTQISPAINVVYDTLLLTCLYMFMLLAPIAFTIWGMGFLPIAEIVKNIIAVIISVISIIDFIDFIKLQA